MSHLPPACSRSIPCSHLHTCLMVVPSLFHCIPLTQIAPRLSLSSWSCSFLLFHSLLFSMASPVSPMPERSVTPISRMAHNLSSCCHRLPVPYRVSSLIHYTRVNPSPSPSVASSSPTSLHIQPTLFLWARKIPSHQYSQPSYPSYR